MARKQNQKALYEAIRQGQAKIAEGLKTGQMRSDRKRFVKSGVQSTPYVPPTAQSRHEAAEEENYSGSVMSPKTALILLAVIVQVVVLAVGIWLGAAYFKGKDKAVEASPEPVAVIEPGPRKSETIVAPIFQLPEEPAPAKVSQPVRVAEKTEKKPEPVVAAKSDVPPAGNVIVIQGIEQGRESELAPLKDFFIKKGIATEIIVREGRALLVTSETFAANPESRGTPGYAVMQQIKEFGLSYPKETGDTKFGIKPFQDCYGLLK